MVQRLTAGSYGLGQSPAVGQRIEAASGGIDDGGGVAAAARKRSHLGPIDPSQIITKWPPLFDELRMAPRSLGPGDRVEKARLPGAAFDVQLIDESEGIAAGFGNHAQHARTRIGAKTL